jgi:predicted nucleotide-binding protein
MAKRGRTPVSTPHEAQLNADEKRSAIARLEKRVAELRQFDPKTIESGDDPQIVRLSGSIENSLAAIFGPDSHQYRRLIDAKDLDQTNYFLSFDGRRTAPHEIQQGVESGRDRAIAILEQAADSLKEELEHSGGSATVTPVTAAAADLSKIFIVHGHDEGAREETARFISKAGLEPIILHEQASGGRTVIEKLEHYSNVGFAVVLLTPDDIGGPKSGGSHPRARQNVIAELFYFIGKLGRAQVCALKKGDVEIPSDIGGVVYVPMDERGAWKMDLLRELKLAGYEIDWAKALA